ncbi:MAG: c-type cytochrome [Rubrivivax sp.]
MNARRTLALFAAAALGLALLLALAVWVLDRPGDLPPPAAGPADPARGEYLARVGHCAGCHTARGGAAYAGGGAVATPFGTVYAANLTPDPATGIGRWTEQDFRRALHEGRGSGGRRLVPACPYPNFTRVDAADLRDLYAWLRTLPPVAQPNRPHALRFPYGTQAALAVWRALYFRPGAPPRDPARSEAWNRGAYLVGGLAHCNACHGARNAWGATAGATDFSGAALPAHGWVAPALDDPHEAGVAGWSAADVTALLADGRNAHASVSGPMAMVVARSTRFLNPADLAAIAEYLRSLPQRQPERAEAEPPPPDVLAAGRRIYEDHCAGCHGGAGEGAAPMVPALAGNRALGLDSPANLLRVVLGGAFGPSTPAHPRPFGMPPFANRLGNDEVAAVVTYLRWTWGPRASAVGPGDVDRARGG